MGRKITVALRSATCFLVYEAGFQPVCHHCLACNWKENTEQSWGSQGTSRQRKFGTRLSCSQEVPGKKQVLFPCSKMRVNGIWGNNCTLPYCSFEWKELPHLAVFQAWRKIDLLFGRAPLGWQKSLGRGWLWNGSNANCVIQLLKKSVFTEGALFILLLPSFYWTYQAERWRNKVACGVALFLERYTLCATTQDAKGAVDSFYCILAELAKPMLVRSRINILCVTIIKRYALVLLRISTNYGPVI